MRVTEERRVLIVDDDDEVRDALRAVLVDEGYRTAQAGDGQAALDYLRSHPLPCLILLDWNMAPMNGQQFMARLAKEPVLSKTPVVEISADVIAPELLAENNFHAYLSKPIDLDALFDIVGRHSSCSRDPPPAGSTN